MSDARVSNGILLPPSPAKDTQIGLGVSPSVVRPKPLSAYEEYLPSLKDLAQGYWYWQTHSTPSQALKDAATGFSYGAGGAAYAAGWATAPELMAAAHKVLGGTAAATVAAASCTSDDSSHLNFQTTHNTPPLTTARSGDGKAATQIGLTNAQGQIEFGEPIRGKKILVTVKDETGKPVEGVSLQLLTDHQSGLLFLFDPQNRFQPQIISATAFLDDQGVVVRPLSRGQVRQHLNPDFIFAAGDLLNIFLTLGAMSQDKNVVGTGPDDLRLGDWNLIRKLEPSINPDHFYVSKQEAMDALVRDMAERQTTTALYIGAGCASGALYGAYAGFFAAGIGALPGAVLGCKAGKMMAGLMMTYQGKETFGTADIGTLTAIAAESLAPFRNDQKFTIADIPSFDLTAKLTNIAFESGAPGGKFKMIVPVEPDDLHVEPSSLTLANDQTAPVRVENQYSYFRCPQHSSTPETCRLTPNFYDEGFSYRVVPGDIASVMLGADDLYGVTKRGRQIGGQITFAYQTPKTNWTVQKDVSVTVGVQGRPDGGMPPHRGMDAGMVVHGGMDAGMPQEMPRVRRVGEDVQVALSGEALSIVWSGIEYGAKWYNNNDHQTYFARLSGACSKIGNEIQISSNDYESFNISSLASNGMEYGISWVPISVVAGIDFARVNQSGAKIGSDVGILNAPTITSVNLLWTGSEYALVASNDEGKLYFAHFQPQTGSFPNGWHAASISIQVGSIDELDTTWSGSEYGVVWQNWNEGVIHFIRLNGAGVQVGGVSQIGTGQLFSIAWNGLEYAIVWRSSGDGRSYFTRVDAMGNKVGSDKRIPFYGTLVWNGHEYGMVGVSSFVRLDSQGNVIGQPFALGTTDNDMTWNGEEYAILGKGFLPPDISGGIYCARLQPVD